MPDFATKLRREPAAMRGADVEGLREHGLSDEQILSVTLIACLFNFMTRLADGGRGSGGRRLPKRARGRNAAPP